MNKIWVEVEYSPPSAAEFSESFVARVSDNLEEEIFSKPDDAFVRFEFVRWLDEEDNPIANEEDDIYGQDHYFFLRRSTIFRVAPLRGEYLARWDATLPTYAE